MTRDENGMLDAWLKRLPEAMAGKDLSGLSESAVLDVANGSRHLITLSDGRVTVERLAEGRSADARNVVKADAGTMLALIEGRLSPVMALLTGRVRVKGNAKALLRLVNSLL